MKRFAPRLVVVVSVLVVNVFAGTGCMFGPSVRSYPPARDPSGMSVRVETRLERLEGELLAAEPERLVLVVGGKVTVVPVARVRALRPAKAVPGLPTRGRPSAASLDRLRPVSRYPQGISPALMGQLLAAYGQSEPRTIR